MDVIRAPGALWGGASGVDGVINITTNPAASTQSAIVKAGAGTEERGSGSVRYGGKMGDDTHYRIYGKYFDWGPSNYASGGTAHAAWDAIRGGVRADWTPTGSNSLTVQGDSYRSHYDETLTVPDLTGP